MRCPPRGGGGGPRPPARKNVEPRGFRPREDAQVHIDHPVDATRSRRHDDDAVRQKHGFGHAVRDEHDRRVGLRPDVQQLAVEALARHLIQRAEGLVHQEHRWPERQGAGDADTLLHAARELPGIAIGKLCQSDQVQECRGALTPLIGGDAHDLQRELNVPRDRPPLVEHRLLKHDAVLTRQARLARRLAVDANGASGRQEQIAEQPQQRALATARWTDERDERARANLQGDVLQRANRLASVGGGERHRHVLE